MTIMDVIDSIDQRTIQYKFNDNTHNKNVDDIKQRSVIQTHTYSYKSAREFYKHDLGDVMGFNNERLWFLYNVKHNLEVKYK